MNVRTAINTTFLSQLFFFGGVGWGGGGIFTFSPLYFRLSVQSFQKGFYDWFKYLHYTLYQRGFIYLYYTGLGIFVKI